MNPNYVPDEQVLNNQSRAKALGVEIPGLAEPTVGQTYKNFSAPTVDSSYDTMANEIGNYYQQEASQPINDRKIYRDTLRQYQAQIDATNKIYNDQLRSAQMEGQGRLGSARALSARSGTLGSDFGNAQNEEVIGYNRGIESSIQNERAMKIAEIMGTARKGAAEEAAAKRLAKQQGAEKYLEFLSSKTERRQKGLSTLAKALLSQGIDPNELDPNELKQIATQYGVSEDDIKATYFDSKKEYDASQAEADLKTRKTEAEIAKLNDKSFTLSEGQSYYDSNGKLVASKAKTYAPSTTGSSGAGVSTGALTDRTGRPIKLTAAQVDTITSFDNATQAAQKALMLLQNAETGPLAAIIHGGKKLVDKADDTELKLEQTLSKMKADYMKALSGAAVSESEVKRLAKFLPDLGDQEGVLKSKLENLMQELASNKENFSRTLGAVGTAPDVRMQVDSAGYDYDAMRADGLSDEEILNAIQNGG